MKAKLGHFGPIKSASMLTSWLVSVYTKCCEFIVEEVMRESVEI
jgi:hypothetical protein